MRGSRFIHLAFVGLLVLMAVLQATFRENWDALAQALDARQWERAQLAPPGESSPYERLRKYKISEKTRVAAN